MAAENKAYLIFLTQALNKQIKVLLQNSSKAQIISLREVLVNVLRGVVPINDQQKLSLRKYKTFYRNLAVKSQNRCILVRNSKAIKLLLTVSKSTLEKL